MMSLSKNWEADIRQADTGKMQHLQSRQTSRGENLTSMTSAPFGIYKLDSTLVNIKKPLRHGGLHRGVDKGGEHRRVHRRVHKRGST